MGKERYGDSPPHPVRGRRTLGLAREKRGAARFLSSVCRQQPLWVFMAMAVLMVGCRNFMEDPYFKVEESGLNWVFIRHYNLRATPVQRVSVRLDGSGIATVRDGASLLVTNPFATNHGDPNWNDCRENRITIPRDDVRSLFQMLVDAGLFEKRDRGGGVSTNEAIFVSANIQGKTCGSEDDILLCDPELAENLKSIVQMFYQPRPNPRR